MSAERASERDESVRVSQMSGVASVRQEEEEDGARPRAMDDGEDAGGEASEEAANAAQRDGAAGGAGYEGAPVAPGNS